MHIFHIIAILSLLFNIGVVGSTISGFAYFAEGSFMVTIAGFMWVFLCTLFVYCLLVALETKYNRVANKRPKNVLNRLN